MVPLTITSGEKSGAMNLLWPAAKPDAVFPTDSSEEATEEPTETPAAAPAEPPPSESPSANPAATSGMAPYATFDQGLERLPGYSRSLLRIRVPVKVTLAEKRQMVNSITDLGTGSIIRFDKACEEMLDLSVGDQAVAKGEAVKVGDKFGLRITSIVMPDERFESVAGGKPADDESQ